MRRILVVDDDARLLEAVQETLELCGCEVRTARTPGQATRHIRAQPFDAIITDLVMAGNGLGLLRRVRDLRLATPVIVMSGLGTPDARHQAQRDGAFDFVVKPVELSTLIAVLNRAFASVDQSLVGENGASAHHGPRPD
jgi:DNA-binding NtrC family response regulator